MKTLLILTLALTLKANDLKCEDFKQHHERYKHLDWIAIPSITVEAMGTTQMLFCIGVNQQEIKKIHVYDDQGRITLMNSKHLYARDYPFIRFKDLPRGARWALASNDIATLQLVRLGEGAYQWIVKMPSGLVKFSDTRTREIVIDLEITQSSNIKMYFENKEFDHFEPVIDNLKIKKVNFYLGNNFVTSKPISYFAFSERVN